MLKKIIIILLISILAKNAFSQDFRYYFNNNDIVKYLKENPQEIPFNDSKCSITGDTSDYNCADIFGVIKQKKINDSVYYYLYKNGKHASEITEIKDSRFIKEFYYNTDTVYCIKEYKDGKFWNITFYGKNKKKLGKGAFKNGNGQLKYYRQNGTLSSIMNVINGELDGRITLYYSNGDTMLTGLYKAGKETGEWEEFLPQKLK
jgi:antitoxin component YwqK of YwqJK toxin-antitoxin module